MKTPDRLVLLILSLAMISCQNKTNTEGKVLDQELSPQERQEQELRRQLLEIQYADATTTVLKLDAPLYQMYKSDLGVMCARMRDIDLSSCPRDFKLAYLDHIHAWEDMARIQQAFIKLREQSDLAIVAGMVATLTEAKASPFSDYLEAEAELDRLGRQADEEITETWQVLERLTISYGGELPK
jgi:hypothetical protein